MSPAQALADALIGPSITVQVKHEYGMRRVYPICWRAELFAAIAGAKTLSDLNLSRIKDLGFTVEGIAEQP